MAGAKGAGGARNQQSMVLVAIVIGAGLIFTVGALVFRSHDDRIADTATTTAPTTVTTGATLAGDPATTTSAPGPTGITYTDPNKIYRMTLGPGWTDGPATFDNSPSWLAPVPGGTAQVNPTLSRAAGPDSLPQFVQSTRTRMDQGPLYRTTGTQPTTLADGTPATIVSYVSSTGALLEGRALVAVKGLWGMAMLIQCPPEGADACFAALDPYVKSVTFI